MSLLPYVLPALITEVGQGVRQWLEHRRAKRVADLEEQVKAMEARLTRLENSDDNKRKVEHNA